MARTFGSVVRMLGNLSLVSRVVHGDGYILVINMYKL